MRKITASIATAALLVFGRNAGAAEPPYLKLAQALGTPDLIASTGAPDKSQLELKFSKEGETLDNWTKLTTVSIIKVPIPETQDSTLAVIASLRDTLNARHVHVDRFDAASDKPYTCFFEYHVGSERDKGIAYSPHSGFVTIAQVAEKLDDTITSDDVEKLKEVIAR
jgi:hypothetical protein